MDQALRSTRESGVTLLLWSGAVTLAVGGVVALVGWLVQGAAAGFGAVVGTGLVVTVCVGGALLVNAVAGALPSASLMVALLTYTLQVMLLVVAFVALERSGLLESSLDRMWVGATAIAATLEWLVAQVVLTFRTRIPTYDLTAEAGDR